MLITDVQGTRLILMAKVNSNKRRTIVRQYAEGLEVIIFARQSRLVNLVLVFWMMGWVYGEVAILNKLISIGDKSPDAILVFWIGGWTLGGLFAVFLWLWNFRGREIIRISDSELRHSREYVFFSRSRYYQTSLITNLRLNPLSMDDLEIRGGMEFWGLTGGTVAFDYERGIQKFGLGIDEAEAIDIIKAILSRFENLG